MTGSYLLDTQTLILWRMNSSPLGRKAVRLLQDGSSRFLFRVASVWEIATKRSLGKLDLGVPTEEFVQTAVAAGVLLLDIRPAHACAVESLVFHHRDPFDRLLTAQALAEGTPIIGRASVFKRYGVKVLW